MCRQLCGAQYLLECPELQSLDIQLRRQLEAAPVAQVVPEDDFENKNTRSHSSSSCLSLEHAAANDSSQGFPVVVNSTAVLYFDHLVHATPNDHVESAAR